VPTYADFGHGHALPRERLAKHRARERHKVGLLLQRECITGHWVDWRDCCGAHLLSGWGRATLGSTSEYRSLRHTLPKEMLESCGFHGVARGDATVIYGLAPVFGHVCIVELGGTIWDVRRQRTDQRCS
jgi:hypothetical protein